MYRLTQAFSTISAAVSAAGCLVVLLVCRTQLVNVVCFYLTFEQIKMYVCM